jgi:general secretion pathway protein G
MVYRKRELGRVARHGFTLMEILVVVAIILILAGLGGYYFMGQLKESRKSTAKIQIKTLEKAAQNYMVQHGDRPPDQLQDLRKRDSSGGPYLENNDALYDPWGNVFQYNAAGSRNEGLKPDIWCVSPDGVEIGNWSSR